MSLEEALEHFSTIHRKQISKDLFVRIGNFSGMNYLSLVLEDTKNDRHIILRLRTFRKLIKWMFKKKFTDRPRRLSILEKFFSEPTPQQLKEEMKVDKKEIRKERLKHQLDVLNRDIKDSIEKQQIIQERRLRTMKQLEEEFPPKEDPFKSNREYLNHPGNRENQNRPR